MNAITPGAKNNFFLRFPWMVARLLKTSRYGKAAAAFDCIFYFLGFLKWHISLAIVKPLNFVRESAPVVIIRKGLCKFLFKAHFFESDKPVNLSPQHQNRFLNDYYVLKPLEILRLENHHVYLTAYHGIAFKKFQIVPESIHGKWDRRNVDLLKEYYPLAMDSWLYSRHDTRQVTELPADQKYLLAHHWFNYYHWLTETVLRLWKMKEEINDYTVLLPEPLRNIQFVQMSLEALKVRNVRYVKEGIVSIKNLVLVQNKPYCNHYFPQLTREIGQYFSEYVRNKGITAPDFGDRIFISRKKAERRRLINEEEVERLLSAQDFRSVVLEDFDFFQQVSIMSNARYLIGMHGAGMTNPLFMPQGGKILELHRELYSSRDLFSDVYWKLAVALGHQYFYQFCEAENRQDDFFKANYLVDLKELKRNVEEFVR